MPSVSYGIWAPDASPIGPPHLVDAQGCFPAADHYRPLPGLAVTTSALTARCLGLYGARDTDQVARMFAGDTTKLYQLSGLAWTDFSKVGGYGPATNSTRWRFTTFGDRLIATNGIDALQYLDMSSGATAFADLAGAPGSPDYIATYLEFVFGAVGSLGGMFIKWCAAGNSESWTAGVGQSDEQEFADGGRITGLGATQAALYVFQEKCIRRVLYVGGATIMQIDKIVDGIGCVEPNSLVQYGQRFYFLSEDGFYEFDGVTDPRPIGADLFDRWWLNDSSRAYWNTMSAAIDPRNKVFALAYASTASGSGVPDTILFYDYVSRRATYARVATEIIANAISPGVSPDDLTTYVPDDHPEIGPDDPFWLGGSLYLAAMDSDHKLSSFAGDNVAATFELSRAPLFEGMRASVEWIKPLTDDLSATVAGGSVVRAGDAVTYQSAVSQQASGRCPQRNVNGFFIAAKVTHPAASTWTYSRGIEFKAKAAGVR